MKLEENKENIVNKKKKTHAIVITIVTAFILLALGFGIPYFIIKLLANAQWHTININEHLYEMKNEYFKEIIKREFDLDDETYITKIKYESGFDDGNVYEICVYYDNGEDCIESSSGFGRYEK